ncbi:MAG TPA: Asp-tRNA(Asn)/Glu-tRNA(Gln) amidotransferase subunit GatB [bacterium]|nr:Asp-tRNA(Asn)/Glu-tRNA(Gln) amidotransferase subunit GatB [bacterium]HPG82234.1 Asp-tRNA(Asn)/Glu-tRNA(Gln) amidotransferase subunit GatB [bacterium]HPM58512.1 Asp-tRNA(Asn)/Glu-tRNA(Gln) amidotransferase subunit GatB [bacterium]
MNGTGANSHSNPGLVSAPFEVVIGLEVHIQLQTRSKIFCGCSVQFGAEANSQVCPVCLGLPGALPVLNEKVLASAARLALATGCRINPVSLFARKNYFYPDLPKGYQISQFDQPFASGGGMTVTGEGDAQRAIRIRRIHLEDDAGRSIHAEAFVAGDETLLDLNRCGVPLLELVTEPDLRSPAEAADFMQRLRQLVRYLGISSGNMEEGSLRCDANISLRPAGSDGLGVKTELKNMNSFRHVERALAFEIARQGALLAAGGRIEQQTLLWDPARGVAEPMRSKEEAHDYRYFPEPDLMPVAISGEWVEELRRQMPELPEARKARYEREFGLPAYDAGLLTGDPGVADYFERLATLIEDKKLASNWVMGEVLRASNARGCSVLELKMPPEHLAVLLDSLSRGRIHQQAARRIFAEGLENGLSPAEAIEREAGAQIQDTDQLRMVVREALTSHPDETEAWLGGKDKLAGFFTGVILQSLQGRADPRAIMALLQEERKALLEKRG